MVDFPKFVHDLVEHPRRASHGRRSHLSHELPQGGLELKPFPIEMREIETQHLDGKFVLGAKVLPQASSRHDLGVLGRAVRERVGRGGSGLVTRFI